MSAHTKSLDFRISSRTMRSASGLADDATFAAPPILPSAERFGLYHISPPPWQSRGRPLHLSRLPPRLHQGHERGNQERNGQMKSTNPIVNAALAAKEAKNGISTFCPPPTSRRSATRRRARFRSCGFPADAIRASQPSSPGASPRLKRQGASRTATRRVSAAIR